MRADRGAAEASGPRTCVWRDEAPEGKLDLLLTLDFRMTSTTIFSDVVLPAATWYEKHDLNTTDMHPFVHSFNPAIAPPWQTRTDWDAFQTIADEFSELAATHLGVRKDVVAVPLLHDTPDAMANPHGVVRDWKHGRVRAGPGRDHAEARRGRARLRRGRREDDRARPAAGHARARPPRASPSSVEREVDYLRHKNGAVRGGVADGRPSLERDVHACEAILALSGTTNGHLATQGFRTLEKRTGVAAGRPRRRARGQADHLRRHPGPPGPGDHLAGVVGLGDRRPPLLAVHHQRRAAQAVAHADRAAALLPRPRLDDRARRGAAGLPAAAEHARAVRRAAQLGETAASSGLTVRYLTPHNKWSIHSRVPGQPVHAHRSRAAARRSG